MNFTEREELKDLGRRLIATGETPEVRAEGHLMVVLAYFHRNPQAKTFEIYGSNYLAANGNEIDPEALALLMPRFPQCTKRMIKTGFSDWGSYGNPSYRA
jgi:hypothetical protein